MNSDVPEMQAFMENAFTHINTIYCPCLCVHSSLLYYGVLLNGFESVYVFYRFLYMYCRWKSSFQEGLDPIKQINPVTCCACPKPGPGFATSYVVFYYLCSMNLADSHQYNANGWRRVPNIVLAQKSYIF